MEPQGHISAHFLRPVQFSILSEHSNPFCIGLMIARS